MAVTQVLLKALLDEGGVDYRQNSKSFILRCPRCRKREKLYIRKTDGRFVCWYCREVDGFQGAPEYAFRELLDRPVAELQKLFYGDGAVPARYHLDLGLLGFYGDDDELPADAEPPPEVLPDPGFRTLDTEAGAAGRRYLESRGVPLEVAMQYDLQYWPEKARVIFPVKSGGRWLGWQARFIRDTEWYDADADVPVTVPKVLSSAGMKRDRVLMFGDRVTSDYAVLCEGPIDALKAHRCGGNVATMGKAVSRQQLQLLRNAGVRRIYLGLDPDAFLEAQRLLRDAGDMEFYDLRPPAPYADLGAMPMDAVYDAFRRAPRIDRAHLFVYLKDHYHAR